MLSDTDEPYTSDVDIMGIEDSFESVIKNIKQTNLFNLNITCCKNFTIDRRHDLIEILIQHCKEQEVHIRYITQIVDFKDETYLVLDSLEYYYRCDIVPNCFKDLIFSQQEHVFKRLSE